MSNFNALARATEVNCVVADNVAATYHGKANAAGFPRPGISVTRPFSDVVEIFSPGMRDSFTHGQRRSRWGINLVAVVRFKYFNVIATVKQASSHFQQLERDVDPDAHIGCENNGGFLAGGLNGFLAGFIKAGGTDHAFHAMLNASLQVTERRLGASEVDQAVCVGEGGQIVGDAYAGLNAEESAGVLPYGGRIRAIQRNG